MKIFNLLFPPRCPFCRKLTGQTQVCEECRRALPYVGDTLFAVEGFDCAAALYYEESVEQAIHNFKFNGRRGMAPLLAGFMAEAARDRLSGRFDTVTWVPVSRKRLRARGYDQAQLLAVEAATRLALPLLPTLEKIEERAPQTAVSGAERRDHVRGAFSARSDVAAGGRFLLVDDILTTGATLAECAGVLRQAGAASVVGVTLAKTRELHTTGGRSSS